MATLFSGLIRRLKGAADFGKFGVAKKGNGLKALAQIAPKLVQVPRFRKTSGHADDGDAGQVVRSVAHAVTGSRRSANARR